MKLLKIPFIAIAVFLTGCSTASTLDVPPSIKLSVPPIPASINVDPEPLGQLKDGSLGTLATEDVITAEKYGELSIRFNLLRQLYHCVAFKVTNDQDPQGCPNVVR